MVTAFVNTLMMATIVCQLCEYCAPALPSYISHLRLVHAEDPRFDAVCGIDGCHLRLKTFNGFSCHIYRHHRVALGLEEPEMGPEEPTTGVGSGIMSHCLQQPMTSFFLGDEAAPHQNFEPIANDDGDSSPRHSVSPFERRKENAAFLLKLLEGRGLSQVAVADVIDGCRRLCAQTLDKAREKLSQSGIETDDSIFSDIDDRFEQIHTPYLLEKFVSEHLNYVVSYSKYCIYTKVYASNSISF